MKAIIAIKQMKYLGINLVKEVNYSHTENSETLVKKT